MPNSKAFGLLIAALLIGASMSVTAAVPPYNGSPAYDVMMHSPYDFSGNPVAADEPPWHAFFEAPATPAISPGFEYTDTQDLTQLSNFDLLYMQQGEADALSGGDMETVRAWTQAGGILVILVTTPQTSALGAYFGPAYEFTSTGDPDGNNISVTDPGASILNVPNALDDVSLSNWGSSVHGALASTGGAYHCVADDSESGVPESALPVLCTAPYGSGAIIIMGFDPDCDCHDDHLDIPPGTNAGSEFFENLVLYQPDAGYRSVPTLTSWALLALGLLLTLVTFRRLRRQS